MNVSIKLLFVWMSLLAFDASANTPEKELQLYSGGLKEHDPVFVRSPLPPGPAALLGGRLYLSEASEACSGKNLYVYDPLSSNDSNLKGTGNPKKIADIPCIDSLSVWGEKILVRHRSQGKGSTLSVWDPKAEALNAKFDLGSHVSQQIANVKFQAYKIKPIFRKGTFPLRILDPFSSNSRFGFLLSDKETEAVGFYAAGLPTKKSKPALWGPIQFPKSPVEIAFSGAYFYVSYPSTENTTTISKLIRYHITEADTASIGTVAPDWTKLEAQKVSLDSAFVRSLRFLRPTPAGGVLFSERSQEPGENQVIWYWGPQSKGLQKLALVPAHDLSGLSVLENGSVLVSRARARRVDLYAPVAAIKQKGRLGSEWKEAVKNRTKVNATPYLQRCGTLAIGKLSDTHLELSYLGKEGVESIPLLRFHLEPERRDQWVCDSKTSTFAFLTKKSELELVNDHLELDLTFATKQKPLGSYAKALSFLELSGPRYRKTKDKPRLKREQARIESTRELAFVVQGKKLGLVFAPLATTQFKSIRKSRMSVDGVKDPFFEIFPSPANYTIMVNGTGKYLKGAARFHGEGEEEVEEGAKR